MENDIDPIRDIEIINVELMLSDLEIVDARIGRIEKKATQTKDKDLLKELDILKRIKNGLEENIPVRRLDISEDDMKIINSFRLITAKPIIYMANISEEDLVNDRNIYVDKIREYAKAENAKVITVSAKIEEELSELDDEERDMFLSDLGVSSGGLDKLIQATYSLLGLATYFTAGKDEVRAWTFKKGMKAPECAGIIHTDFEKGFIRAEVMSYDDLEKYGDEKKVREAGRVRLEGKEYLMQDGDICYFRFNV